MFTWVIFREASTEKKLYACGVYLHLRRTARGEDDHLNGPQRYSDPFMRELRAVWASLPRGMQANRGFVFAGLTPYPHMHASTAHTLFSLHVYIEQQQGILYMSVYMSVCTHSP